MTAKMQSFGTMLISRTCRASASSVMAIAVLFAMTEVAFAQWRSIVHEEGPLVTSAAYIDVSGGRAAVFCEGIPDGRPPIGGEAMVTDPGMVAFSLNDHFFKSKAGGPIDVAATLTVDGRAWTGSFMHFTLFETMAWQMPLDSEFIAALKTGSRLTVRTSIVEVVVPLVRSDRAIGAAVEMCASLFPG